MGKIPVGRTIAGAYRFAFGRFGAVLGVVWLPIALMAIAGYFLFHGLTVPAVDPNEPNPTAREILNLYVSAMGPLPMFELVLWAASIMIQVGLTRAALGIGGTPYVFFTLGPPFWRMLGANLLFAVALLIVIVPAAVIFAFLMALTAGVGSQLDASHLSQVGAWLAVPMVLLILAAFFGYYYLFARLWFFIAPVVVAEKHIDIRRGWALAKGNVLRIVGIMIAIWLPPILLLAAAEGVALLVIMANTPAGQLPSAQLFADRWAIFVPAGIVIALVWLLLSALSLGARAVAYRALVPASETVPPE